MAKLDAEALSSWSLVGRYNTNESQRGVNIKDSMLTVLQNMSMTMVFFCSMIYM